MNKKIRHMSNKLDIINIYLRDYSSSFSGREISRRLNVSPQTGLSVLNSLVKEKILKVLEEGRNKMYSLNLENFQAKLMIELAEKYKSRILANNFELSLIIEKLLPLAETIIVFGSFAKNTEKESSDIDLIILSTNDKNKIDKEIKLFSREINIFYFTWNKFVQILKQKEALAIEVKKDHLIYGNAFKVVEVYCP